MPRRRSNPHPFQSSMDKLIVEGGHKLSGRLNISGSKNASLPILAASLLTDDPVRISRVPDVSDTNYMIQILSQLGASVERSSGTVRIESPDGISSSASYEQVRKMRASICLLGPMMARMKRCTLPLPGGCVIGDRPVDLHVKAIQALGARVRVKGGNMLIEAPNGLVGTTVDMRGDNGPTVLGTDNLMMAAVLARGTTVIESAAREPEVVDLANFLNKMGAKIRGAGTDTIKIDGVEKRHGARHTVIPDRIETATFMLAAAITRGAIAINNCIPDHVKPVIAKLRECGVRIEVHEDSMIVRGDLGPHNAANIKTLPYPGFPTDVQSPFMAYLTTVEGQSEVIETVFENRFMHVTQLDKMGAMIDISGNKAIIRGNSHLRGSQVMATDLRAGAALVLAGFVADGETEVSEIYHIERGYEHFIEKFAKLGGTIRKVEN